MRFCGVGRSLLGLVAVVLLSLATCPSPSYGYDPLDPNGNITVKWDIMDWDGDTYHARVSIVNYQLFRHIDSPGWKLQWTWQGDEVIWNMEGAVATRRGRGGLCNKDNPPHCCLKRPTIVDLPLGAPYNMQVANCCRGGVLSTMTQDNATYLASFQMAIGGLGAYNVSNYTMPTEFDLGVPGYTCGLPVEVDPSKFPVLGGRRYTEAVGTWNVTCTYSQFRASPSPQCCVSLTAFYSEEFVRCPKCSCGCQDTMGYQCVNPDKEDQVIQLPADGGRQPVVRCTRHMCPIRVHWHVKLSYREYWRVKITIENFNYVKNYSDWNLVVVHPNLRSINQVFSFQYQPLIQYPEFNDTGMFYGLKYYNDMLLQSGANGSVQTEMLLHKDPGVFSFEDGWAFPRKVSFNGLDCVMPSPEEFPKLPRRAIGTSAAATIGRGGRLSYWVWSLLVATAALLLQ
uniref:COBRA-like protein n=1 Tax=Kalanchoe fedtschenkoi TaxID=63787 RepID=A0A7N0RFR2_KALFE